MIFQGFFFRKYFFFLELWFVNFAIPWTKLCLLKVKLRCLRGKIMRSKKKNWVFFFADKHTAPFLGDLLPSSRQNYALSRVKLRLYQGKIPLFSTSNFAFWGPKLALQIRGPIYTRSSRLVWLVFPCEVPIGMSTVRPKLLWCHSVTGFVYAFGQLSRKQTSWVDFNKKIRGGRRNFERGVHIRQSQRPPEANGFYTVSIVTFGGKGGRGPDPLDSPPPVSAPENIELFRKKWFPKLIIMQVLSVVDKLSYLARKFIST